MENLPEEPAQHRWQPLAPRLRRVVGVLVEKAKTTPDAYPLTLNALTTGCNQKSNRSPQMNLSTDEVEECLEQLRELGAVCEVQGSSRVPRYRHQMYEWLGVDKTELAVMAELLLRGEQTVGELRSRAARMEPIADLSALRPIIQSLLKKNLMLALTPEGRGQVVSHNLYKERELDELRSRAAAHHAAAATDGQEPAPRRSSAVSTGVAPEDFEALSAEVAELRRELGELRDTVEKFEQLMR